MGRKNKNKIVKAIKQLGKSYPSQIKDFLDKEANKLVESQYFNDVLGASKKKQMIRKETISERTLFEWLKKLTKQGLLIREDNQYRLPEQTSSPTEYLAELFGLNILLSITKNPIDTDSSEGLVEAVNCFGVFIIYMLLYGLKSIKDANKEELEDFRALWINRAISPEGMLMMFRNMLGLLDTVSSNRHRKETGFQELGKERYEKLIHYLQVQYPDIFDKINEGTDNMYNIIKPKSR
jgi:DNA-binding HxlR family transcriptional regulator